MANGIFARLTNLWRGFVSLWIADIEKEHPEIAYENAINAMITQYTQLKKATAAIIRHREDITARLEKARASLAQVERDLAAAVAKEAKDLGIVLIQKKTALTQEVGELEAEISAAQGEAESAKASLLQVQGEIDRLKAEKDRMLAKMANAQARLQIQERLDGLSVDAEVRALDTVREHILNTAAQAKLGEELKGSDLDQRLAELRRGSGDVLASEEWEQLKAAKTQKTAKTMG
jgi:phage shock protein A